MLEENKRICSKAQLDDWLAYELPRYCGRGGYWGYLFGFSEKAILRQHQKLLRKTEYYFNTKKRIREFISKVLLRRLQNRHHLSVPLNTCGRGLLLIHLGSVLIHPDACIGENCGININTQIAVAGNKDGAPRIGDSVTIGAGATVMGPIKIADNIIIGANSLVNKSFLEENIAIAGNPAKQISQNGALSWKCKV